MKKVDFRIIIIIILIIVEFVMCYLYFKNKDISTSENMQLMDSNINFSESNDSQENISNNKETNSIQISSTAEVTSGLTEKLGLHATYYLEESYVQTNQLVKAGENILKYTNGTYLIAPYDCVVTEINIPENSKKCTNEHYIQISSNNNLTVQFKVDETKISNVKLGQEASIKISAYDEKTINGAVTNISSTATNGKFTVTVEFENDEDVRIGMTATVTLQ